MRNLRKARIGRWAQAGFSAGLMLTAGLSMGCAQDVANWYADGLKRVSCSKGERIQDCRYVTTQQQSPEPQS
jgi:hypothetical protein